MIDGKNLVSGLRPDANCHAVHYKDSEGKWVVQRYETYEEAQEAMQQVAKTRTEVWYFGPVERSLRFLRRVTGKL